MRLVPREVNPEPTSSATVEVKSSARMERARNERRRGAFVVSVRGPSVAGALSWKSLGAEGSSSAGARARDHCTVHTLGVVG